MAKLRQSKFVIFGIMLCVSILLVQGRYLHAASSGWSQENGQWYYYREDGTAASGWLNAGGFWYYLSPDSGAMQIGWVSDGGSWYYLKAETGAMAEGEALTLSGGGSYYFDAAGRMYTGWASFGAQWYYYKQDGRLANNEWILDQGNWYYLGENGVMASNQRLDIAGDGSYVFDAAGHYESGWKLFDGKSYYYHPSGRMAVNAWQLKDKNWYYLGADGAAASGWVQDADRWYYLDGSGIMLSGTWVGKYYLGADGARMTGSWSFLPPGSVPKKTGWVQDQGKWYYIDPQTKVLRSGWLTLNGQRYYLKESGEMAVGWQEIQGSWYYFHPDRGIMQTGWLDIGRSRYYLGSSGAMTTGFLTVDGYKRYFWASGELARNTYIYSEYYDAEGCLYKGKIFDDWNSRHQAAEAAAESKLRTAYDFVVDQFTYRTDGARDFLDTEDWYLAKGQEGLETKQGNCYNYASAFAGLAYSLGFDTTIDTGNVYQNDVPVSQHAWVHINIDNTKYYFDPEAEYEFWKTTSFYKQPALGIDARVTRSYRLTFR